MGYPGVDGKIMSKMPVIIAAYHGEKYIGEQLKSLFKQTRIPDEILIGDDSSDDKTFLAVEAVRSHYTGELKYFRNTPRLGVVQNFVHLAKAATGDFIFFCDQDDVWLPEKIEKLATILEQDSTCQVAVCNSKMMDAELNSLHETLLDGVSDFHKKMERINQGKGFFPLLNQSIGLSGHNMAVRKDFLYIFNSIPQNCLHDLWLQYCSGFLGVLRYLDEVLTLYRVHANNTSSPCVQAVKKNLLHRFREIWASSDDVFYIADLLKSFVQFSENYPDNPNRPLLIAYSRYFSWRADLLKLKYFQRMLKILQQPGRLLDHFRYGFGMRSLVRDLIVRPDIPQKQ